MIHFDKIKRMDIKQFARFLHGDGGSCAVCVYHYEDEDCEEARNDCVEGIEQWLAQEGGD